MHILILTDSYPPEVRSAAELMKDLAEGLSDMGHDISVVTSYPGYNLAESVGDFPEISVEHGVRVLRIKTLPHHKVNFLMRGIAQMSMPGIFYRKIKQNLPPADAVFVHVPPLPLYLTAWKLKRLWNAKLILNQHDIFPQNAVDLGMLKNPLLIKFFEHMEKNAYKRADVIVTPSSEHQRFLVERRGVSPDKIKVVPHWINVGAFDVQADGSFREKFNLKNKFVFVFGGVLGPSQGLDLILKAAQKLQHIPDIHFLLVGDGSAKPRLVKMTDDLGLQNVSFEPFVSTREYPKMLKDMDVAFLTLTSHNTTPAVPAKLMGYMAAGMPVLGLLHKESEALKIIREANCGLAAEYGDAALAAELMEKMYRGKDKLKEYSANAKNFALAHFDKSVLIPRIAQIFTELK